MRESPVLSLSLATLLVALTAGCGDSDPGEDDDDDASTGGASGTGYGTGTGTGNGTGTDTGSGTGTGTGSEGCPEIDPKLCGIVAAHNAVRANVSPPARPPLQPLTWSANAATVAADWAATCQFAHNPQLGSLGLGENIFMTSGTATPEEVVGLWAREVSDYDYASNSCSAVCGHYTQIVWRDTTSVGCAVQSCPQGEIWVCDYSPPGNYVGQQPY